MTEDMRNRLLLIIDPQVDFITGTLPVPGAEQAMNALADYMGRHGRDYARIVVTADRHPMRHCSFRSEGGPWPAHCVADSVGAAIWPAVMDQLMATADKVTVLHKGENPDVEEYSILKNHAGAAAIIETIETEKIEQVDICGLAGDVCVAETIRDWPATVGPVAKLNILKEFSPSIDGGQTLNLLSCAR